MNTNIIDMINDFVKNNPDTDSKTLVKYIFRKVEKILAKENYQDDYRFLQFLEFFQDLGCYSPAIYKASPDYLYNWYTDAVYEEDWYSLSVVSKLLVSVFKGKKVIEKTIYKKSVPEIVALLTRDE